MRPEALALVGLAGAASQPPPRQQRGCARSALLKWEVRIALQQAAAATAATHP